MKNSPHRRSYILAIGEKKLPQPDLLPLVESRDDAGACVPEHPWWSKWAGVAVIIALGLFLYGHTLSFPFQFDDHIYLLSSPFIKEMGNFISGHDFQTVATYSLRQGTGLDPSLNFILRPVAYLTFHLNYLLDGFNPRGYRAVNIGIHCANAVFLFLLISHFLRKSPRSSGLSSGSLLFIPLAAALLFVAHPLHTESVTYIVQRFTSMVGLCVLTSSYFYFLSLSVQGRISAVLLRVLSVFIMVCGMLTKESMFTAPLLIVMLHVVVMGATVKRACWLALPHLLCMLIIPSLVILTSLAQTGRGDISTALHIAASEKEPDYRFHYLLTQVGVVIEYIGLILWPHSLNVDREYQLATSLFEPRVIFSALAIVTMVSAAWWWHRTRRDSIRHALICGAVFWYFLRLAVSSSFVPLDDLMVDHRTYGASMGMLTALACGMDMLRTYWSRLTAMRWALPVGLSLWIGALGINTLNRNDVWKSELSLWKDTVAKSPGKARPWHNLGVTHYRHGREEEAMECMVKTVEIDATFITAYVNICSILGDRGNYVEMVDLLRKGLKAVPESADLHYCLGMALCSLGRTTEGIAEFEQAVQLMPTHFLAQASLGQLYRERRNYESALLHYKNAASLGYNDPDMSRAIIHLELLTGAQ